jgi:Ca-activated chloride channel homolog
MGEERLSNARQRFRLRSGSNPKVGEALMSRCRRGPWSFLFASPLTIVALVLLLASFCLRTIQIEPIQAAPPSQTLSGSLGIIGKDGSLKGDCPLKHTEVRGAISGFLARVTVTQVFENSAPNAIEAVYTFPLPQNAAVDDMTIQVGGRTIRSVIKKREEARAIYEKAKATGHTAALLDQERPNIFSQAVANILPGEQVSVTISYAETLQYADGSYEFVFPMVVGPRYIPGKATGEQAGGWAPDTDKVPDASRITPNVAPPETRAGHVISLELAIDAGVPIQKLRSTSHKIDIERTAIGFAKVKLQNEGEIPNKHFVLKYSVAGEQIGDAALSHWVPEGAADGGYFTLILQPPARVPESDITPKELVFVLDTSGSMSGFPIEKGKELISRALDELYPGDTFNIITFSGDTQILFPEPVFPSAENIRLAKDLLHGRQGGGRTEMMKAIRTALAPSDSQDHVRVVCFVTDGYVGNDMEIIGEVHKHPNARVFAFGIGNSVNRFLIEGMAKAGRGDSEVVMLNDKADEAAHRLYERLRSPLLTDLSIDWRGLPVADLYPQRLPDLVDGKPLVVTGRYTMPSKGNIRLRGKRAGEDFVREIPVALASGGDQNNVLAGFWARRRIDDLMSQDWAGAQSGNMKPDVQKEITQLGLDYRLMTQFTSFVAVEDRVVTKDGKPQRVEVPVELPEGVSYEGVFGGEGKQFDRLAQFSQLRASSSMVVVTKGGGGHGSGSGHGVGVATAGVMGGAVATPTVVQNAAPPPKRLPGDAISSAHSSEGQLKLTPERKALESKLHPSLLEAFDCAAKQQQNCKLVHDGKIEVQVWLTENSASILDELRKAGFEAAPDQSAGKTVVGKMPVEKLQALVQMSDVRFVSPVRK